MQASGFEDKEARDCPACLISPGMREDPGSRDPGSSAPLEESGSVAPAPAGRVPGPPRAAAWVCRGRPRSGAGPAQSVGREGKQGRRGVRKEGAMGESRRHPEWNRKKRFSHKRPKGEGDRDACHGGREGERDAEVSALLPLSHCCGGGHFSLLHAHPIAVSSFL